MKYYVAQWRNNKRYYFKRSYNTKDDIIMYLWCTTPAPSNAYVYLDVAIAQAKTHARLRSNTVIYVYNEKKETVFSSIIDTL